MKLDVVGCLHITMVPKTNFMKKYLFLCLNVDNYICLYFFRVRRAPEGQYSLRIGLRWIMPPLPRRYYNCYFLFSIIGMTLLKNCLKPEKTQCNTFLKSRLQTIFLDKLKSFLTTNYIILKILMISSCRVCVQLFKAPDLKNGLAFKALVLR